MATVVVAGPTIAAGQSLSDAADCTAGMLVRILAPMQWTPANMTFQASADGVDFRDVGGPSGAELIVSCTPGSATAAMGSAFRNCFVKLRSGTAAHPVVQEADRTFSLVVLTDPAPIP